MKIWISKAEHKISSLGGRGKWRRKRETPRSSMQKGISRSDSVLSFPNAYQGSEHGLENPGKAAV